jgi:hypothetical protein
MTTDHDSDPDATVKMPRPVVPKADLENIDPDSTLIREDWGSTTILPSGSGAAPPEQPPTSAKPEWEATLRRPAYTVDREPR